MHQQVSLRAIALLFLKLGIIGFGGPAAHIAMMREEVVRKRAWLTELEFLDLVGATNLIPGPNSTELAIHIGHEKGGLRGLLLAGACFIFPAVLLTLGLAVLYQQYGSLPQVRPFIYGIQPAIIAIVLGAVYPLAKKAAKSVGLVIIGLAVLVAAFFNIGELPLMFGAGLGGMFMLMVSKKSSGGLHQLLPIVLLRIIGEPLAAATNLRIFWIFLKIGSVLYGSGYVLFAFLDSELVATGLLGRQQLLDAIAVGQFTPGPVFSAVTFVGYLMNGFSGASLATIAIFLPSFIFVALLKPIVTFMRGSQLFGAFLDAVNMASVALIAVVCYEMGTYTVTDWRQILIAVVSAAVVFASPKKVNSAFIVLGGAVLGYLLYAI